MSTSNEPTSIQMILNRKQAQRDETFAAYLSLAGECAYLEVLLGEQPNNEVPEESAMPHDRPPQDATGSRNTRLSDPGQAIRWTSTYPASPVT